MRDLTELQTELRRLSTELNHLERQVEDLKPKDQTYDISANYAAIQELARRGPIKNPSLTGLDNAKQTRYLRLLCTAAGLDGEISIDQLLYLCRLAEGAGYIVDPGRLTAMAYQTEYLDWQAAAQDLKKAALPLILDAMLVIHLAGRTPAQGLEFTASLAALLECNDEDLTVCAQLAAALLGQNFAAFKDIQAKRAYSSLGYAVPKEWLEKTRKKCRSYKMTVEQDAEMKDGGNGGRISRWHAPILRLMAPKIKITAEENFKSGAFSDQGSKLVNFSVSFIPHRLSDGTEHSFDPDDYILPAPPPPICAPCSGIVKYTTDGTKGERTVWIASPFDQP